MARFALHTALQSKHSTRKVLYRVNPLSQCKSLRNLVEMILVSMTIPMMIMVITVIVRIAKSEPHRFPGNFVSIVDWKRRKLYGGRNIGSLWRTPRTAPSESRLLSAAVAPHGEPEFLRHLGAEALSVVHGVLATVPAELQDGHHDGEGEAAQQHHEHSANVLDTERVGLRVLALVLQTENSQTAARRSGNTDKTNRSERGGDGHGHQDHFH